ncbi:MAG: hypothetical protein J7L42_00715 [Elusimicrobia bacterium]|nr:hypothetical protein [Elusimicrobiota bacterium]
MFKVKMKNKKAQAIVIAVIAIVFMASIGFALLLWFKAESMQTAQKNVHEKTELYGREGVDYGIYWLTVGTATYQWGNLKNSSQTFTLTMEDGTTVQVTIEDVGEM